MRIVWYRSKGDGDTPGRKPLNGLDLRGRAQLVRFCGQIQNILQTEGALLLMNCFSVCMSMKSSEEIEPRDYLETMIIFETIALN